MTLIDSSIHSIRCNHKNRKNIFLGLFFCPPPLLGLHMTKRHLPQPKFLRMVQSPPYLTLLTCSLYMLQATPMQVAWGQELEHNGKKLCSCFLSSSISMPEIGRFLVIICPEFLKLFYVNLIWIISILAPLGYMFMGKGKDLGGNVVYVFMTIIEGKIIYVKTKTSLKRHNLVLIGLTKKKTCSTQNSPISVNVTYFAYRQTILGVNVAFVWAANACINTGLTGCLTHWVIFQVKDSKW